MVDSRFKEGKCPVGRCCVRVFALLLVHVPTCAYDQPDARQLAYEQQASDKLQA